MELIEIPRVHVSQFRSPRTGGEPRVVLENVQHWRALRAWSPDYLKSIAGTSQVSVRETNGPPRNIYQNLAQGGKISFSQYLDWVLETANGEDFQALEKRYSTVSDIVRAVCNSGFASSYYLDAKLGDLSKDLLNDVQIPKWYKADPVDILLWCGVLGTSSGLHFDITPNCNVQVAGHKHFILFAPSQCRLLYRVRGGAHCHFDPNIPNFDRFPLARHAVGWRCTLRMGESLYIPAGWFHQVTVTSAWALNVNFFWPRPFPQGLITPSLWRLLGRRMWARFRARL
jgi:Cupin-like domain